MHACHPQTAAFGWRAQMKDSGGNVTLVYCGDGCCGWHDDGIIGRLVARTKSGPKRVLRMKTGRKALGKPICQIPFKPMCVCGEMNDAKERNSVEWERASDSRRGGDISLPPAAVLLPLCTACRVCSVLSRTAWRQFGMVWETHHQQLRHVYA